MKATESTTNARQTEMPGGLAVDPIVALGEANLMRRLVENRNLQLAQQLHEAKAMISNLAAQVSALEAKQPKRGKKEEEPANGD